MYKLEFALKQHTPLIHFQHDQEGATLRASEVKPKLDRFILIDIGKDTSPSLTNPDDIYNAGIAQAKKYGWLVGNGDKPALDYKLKIQNNYNDFEYFLPLPLSPNPERTSNLNTYLSTKSNNKIQILAPTPYFANTDKIKYLRNEINPETKFEELRIAIQSQSKLSLIIASFKSGLLKEVEKNICVFFLSNNFGTRQDKGFGSFTIFDNSNVEVKYDNKVLQNYFAFKSASTKNSFMQLFKFISDEYQLIKSGKNYPTYEKSKMFDYFISRNIRWEKRFFKQLINANKSSFDGKELFWDKKSAPIDMETKSGNIYNDWTDKQMNNYQYIRALLGLAEQFEYTVFAETNGVKATNRSGNYYSDFQKKYIVSLEHQPKPGKEKIERFKSPIFFKVIDGFVYIAIDDSFNSIVNEAFEFTLKLKGASNYPLSIGSLKTPLSFDQKDFLKKNISAQWTKL